MTSSVRPPAASRRSTDERHASIRRVLLVTLVANVVVIIAKLIAGRYADSLAVLAEAAHSSVDALNNVLGLTLAAVAARAPDREHPYGHAKFETLGALAVVAFLSITVFELVTGAVERLIGGDVRPRVTLGVAAVVAASAIISLAVSVYERRAGRRLGSELLMADAAHTRSDFWAAISVLLGLGIVALGYPRADAVVTLVVALLVGRAGWRILRRTVPVLVDERAVDERRIRALALETPGALLAYDVRSRGREGDMFAEFTIAVDGALDVARAHGIADEVERRVAEALGAREVVVHVEPLDERAEE
ncbi:MAG: cation diffusion facilitator family transporter [Longimicrobiales bacterium]